MKNLIHTILPGVLAILASSAPLTANPSCPLRPNVIFIMADDMGYGDLGSYGQTVIQTPHIDRLAAEGMRFTDAYSGSAVCAPARCVLITGRHTGHCVVRANMSSLAESPGNPEGRVSLPDETVTVAEIFKTAGYVTGITGKWGLGEPGTDGIPNRQGFDEWLGFLNQRRAHTYYPTYIWENENKLPLPGNEGGAQGDWVHDRFTGFGLDFIAKHKDEPFFLYMAYTVPHDKFEIPDTGIYKNMPWTEQEKVYAAMITKLDEDVGRLRTALADAGIADDTLIFFCSDNGAADRYDGRFGSSGPLRGRKRDLYEGGLRVPMIACWPGRVPAGTVSDLPWDFADVLPTFRDLAGGSEDVETDGVSVLPTLLGGSQDFSRRFLYWEMHEGGGFRQAVRRGPWKGIRVGLTGALQLYHLGNDLGEQNNVAAQNPEIVEHFENYLAQAREPSPFWPVAGETSGPGDGSPPGEESFRYDFEDDSAGATGGVTDRSGNGRNATLSNSAAFSTDTPPALGAASTRSLDLSLATNGVNNQSLQSNSPVFAGILGNEARTVSMWMKTASATDQVLMSWGADGTGSRFTVRLDEIDGSNPVRFALRLEVGGGFILGATHLSDNAWHHVAVVQEKGAGTAGVRLYVDGIEEVTSSQAQAIHTVPGGGVVIGTWTVPVSQRSFDGLLDHVSLWSLALDPEQVAILAQGGEIDIKPPLPTDPPVEPVTPSLELSPEDGAYRLCFDAEPLVRYRIESSETLVCWAPWAVVDSNGGFEEILDTESVPQRFYRVGVAR